jgi:uncharacterized membrane protein YphA (DoxX/SURF4 family)
MVAYGLPIARLCLATPSITLPRLRGRVREGDGVDKLRHWNASIEEVRGDGLPWPAAFGAATILTQLAGGCMVATGLLGALLLAGFTVAATVLGHRFWLRHGSEFRHELTTSLEHVAIVGGLLLLFVLDFGAAG